MAASTPVDGRLPTTKQDTAPAGHETAGAATARGSRAPTPVSRGGRQWSEPVQAMSCRPRTDHAFREVAWHVGGGRQIGEAEHHPAFAAVAGELGVSAQQVTPARRFGQLARFDRG